MKMKTNPVKTKTKGLVNRGQAKGKMIDGIPHFYLHKFHIWLPIRVLTLAHYYNENGDIVRTSYVLSNFKTQNMMEKSGEVWHNESNIVEVLDDFLHVPCELAERKKAAFVRLSTHIPLRLCPCKECDNYLMEYVSIEGYLFGRNELYVLGE